MKKVLFLLSLLIITTSFVGVSAAENCGNNANAENLQNKAAIRAQREAAFEKRLGLSEEQKTMARVLREQGHEKIRPVMEQLKAKKHEVEAVKKSRMAVQMQEEKLCALDKEIKSLEKRAHEIRKANMKEFESILTMKQKRILNQMKKEGRKKYQQTHPCKTIQQHD